MKKVFYNKLSYSSRVSTVNVIDPVNYYRHLFAYRYASQLINGSVIEIGCGDGYGIDHIIDKCDLFVAIDKKGGSLSVNSKKSFDYFKIVLPYLTNIPSNIFDFAICYQVIEHIQEDEVLLKEIYRVLKPGGTLLLTTPNRLRSVTRNPWHVKEYTVEELSSKATNIFKNFTMEGVYAYPKLEEYFKINAQKIESIKRWDVFDFKNRMPRWMLKIPYDIANSLFKRTLKNDELTQSIDENDFYAAQANSNCLDLLMIAQK